jgi:hypothetical protein
MNLYKFHEFELKRIWYPDSDTHVNKKKEF